MKFLLFLIGFSLSFRPSSGDLGICGRDVALARATKSPLMKLGRQIHDKLAQLKPNENIVFSPLSIGLSLALAEYGAAGETKRELDNFLADAERNQTQADFFYQSLQKFVQIRDNQNTKLEIANGLFHDKKFHLRTNFTPGAIACYDAKVKELDFEKNKEEARRTINVWVAGVTSQKIPQLIAPGIITEDTKTVLVNAIYLKAPWAEKFHPVESTMEFYRFGRENEKQQVSFIGRVDNFQYVEDDDFQYVSIPYENGLLDFEIVLPKRRDGLRAVQQQMTSEKFKILGPRIRSTKLDLRLPKFTIRTPLKVTPILKEIGLRTVFSDSADFGRLSEQRVKISDIVHEAFINVNENGTEAAAATAVIMGVESLQVGPVVTPKPFIVDHPFLFSIFRKETQTNIFQGTVNFIENP